MGRSVSIAAGQPAPRGVSSGGDVQGADHALHLHESEEPRHLVARLDRAMLAYGAERGYACAELRIVLAHVWNDTHSS